MALVVEDGTGRADSESYITVAAADTRHTALGNTAWTGTDAAKESALRRATQFMLQRYRQQWKGTRLLRAQALDWPRYGAIVDGFDVASSAVPTDIANACADLALRALADDLAPDQERVAIREKVGPLETEYSPHASQSVQYVAVDRALAPYLRGGGMSRLERA
ncbi:MAG: hypothetical protein RL268_285 [Pseudomonadota bacterium]|jgi:hypothetical protein